MADSYSGYVQFSPTRPPTQPPRIYRTRPFSFIIIRACACQPVSIHVLDGEYPGMTETCTQNCGKRNIGENHAGFQTKTWNKKRLPNVDDPDS